MASDRTTLHIAIGLMVTVVVYLASPPFVIYALYGTPHEQLMHSPAMWVFYAPAGWLNDHFPLYGKYILFVLRALGMRI